MSTSPVVNFTEVSSAVETPHPDRQNPVLDILRGSALLGILLVDVLNLSGSSYPSEPGMGLLHASLALLVKFFVGPESYMLFSFLFGWTIGSQRARRAEEEGRSFRLIYVRRLLVLLLIGLTHAVLIWDGDILVVYALLAFPLLLFGERSNQILLISIVACLLLTVLLSTPGLVAPIHKWYGGVVDTLRDAAVEGRQANVYLTGSYLAVTDQRLKALGLSYANLIYSAPPVLAMLLLGFYVGWRQVLETLAQHRLPLHRVMWIGLILGVLLNSFLVLESENSDPFFISHHDLLVQGTHAVGGIALCLSYVSGVILLTQKRRSMDRLSSLASIGRLPLSNYLLQSTVLTWVFYGYGLGLYGKLGVAITIFLALLLFRAQVAISGWWLERYRLGPAEWLCRSIADGEAKPWRIESEQSVALSGPSPGQDAERSTVFNAVTLVLKRFVFVAAVAFAIVYFCMLGLRLSSNSSRVVGQPYRNLWDATGPALTKSVDFFAGLSRGELGLVAPGTSERHWEPAQDVLMEAYADSMRLLVVAVGAAAAIGITAGALAASWRHSAIALPMLTLTVVGVSVPSFFLALLLQIGSIEFYHRTGIRVVLLGPDLGTMKSLVPQMVLPAVVLVARPLAHITRVTFVSVSEVLQQDYVRTARAKGLRAVVVFWRHVLRNAGVSILTAVVVSLRFSLGSLPVVEVFFDWPGLGVTMLNGIFQREANVVAGAALGLGVTFLVINTGLDLMYRVIDPRLRKQNGGGIQ